MNPQNLHNKSDPDRPPQPAANPKRLTGAERPPGALETPATRPPTATDRSGDGSKFFFPETLRYLVVNTSPNMLGFLA